MRSLGKLQPFATYTYVFQLSKLYKIKVIRDSFCKTEQKSDPLSNNRNWMCLEAVVVLVAYNAIRAACQQL